MVFFVYKLTFSNGKIYIGCSRTDSRGTFDARYKEHDYAARVGSNLPVHKAWRKHGAPSKEILCMHRTKNECMQYEQDAILCFDSTNRNVGYNVTRGGDGMHVERGSEVHARIGAKTWGNDDWRADISQRFKGRADPRSPEGKDRQRQAAVRLTTPEHASRMRAAAFANPETVAKFEAGRAAWRESDENAAHCRRMAQRAAEACNQNIRDVSTGIEYESMTAAAQSLNVSVATISRRVKAGKLART